MFADGVVWDSRTSPSREPSAATADTLAGTPSLDLLDGGAGNDHLSGGDDADVYVFGRGLRP